MSTLVLGKGETEIFLSAGTRDLGLFLMFHGFMEHQKQTQVHVLATGGHHCCLHCCCPRCHVRPHKLQVCAAALITYVAALARPHPRRNRMRADANPRARGRDRIRCRVVRGCRSAGARSGKRTVVLLRMPVGLSPHLHFHFLLRPSASSVELRGTCSTKFHE